MTTMEAASSECILAVQRRKEGIHVYCTSKGQDARERRTVLTLSNDEIYRDEPQTIWANGELQGR